MTEMNKITEFIYQEPVDLALGRIIYEQFSSLKNKGNVISILSDAMTTLRQLGTTGLALWIDTNNGERQFIRTALQTNIAEQLGLSHCLASEQQDIEVVWGNIENLMQVLRYAKYYAKTREKQKEND
jgi:hypothetical protein